MHEELALCTLTALSVCCIVRTFVTSTQAKVRNKDGAPYFHCRTSSRSFFAPRHDLAMVKFLKVRTAAARVESEPSRRLSASAVIPQPGKVVVVLAGRYAGKKAVIVKNHDDGTSTKPYGHALVVGLSKEPRKVCARVANYSDSVGASLVLCARRRARFCCHSMRRRRLNRFAAWQTGHQAVVPQEAGQEVHRQGENEKAHAVCMDCAWGRRVTLTPSFTFYQQTFIKTVNYNHIMPTRYTLDVDFKASVSTDILENSTKKVEVQKVRGRRDAKVA